MGSGNVDAVRLSYNLALPALHTLHECRSVEQFRSSLEAATGSPLERIVDHVVQAAAPKAIFVVGSIPLGMGTSGSDIDLVVLADGRTALVSGEERVANSDQQIEFSSESDMLLARTSLTLMQGILVEVQVVLTPTIHQVYRRLRRRGPELSEVEMRTLSRLSRGWLLWETAGYLQESGLYLRDPSLAVYCSTRSFVSALLQRGKAARALERSDIPLALHHGRLSVEDAYLAYFASEGLPHLGSKWLAQIGRAPDAAQRVARHPLLAEGIRLLFPTLFSSVADTAPYLREASDFVVAMRSLIERNIRFRIAYAACPQIASAR
jgi:Nucleotidyltransferase domain